jgi:hypothetical protein
MHLSNVAPVTQSKGGWRFLDRNTIKEIFGLFPEPRVDHLSLLGDSSDKIAGVEAIRVKKAEIFSINLGILGICRKRLIKFRSRKIRKNVRNSVEITKGSRCFIALQRSIEFNIPTIIDKSAEDIFNSLQNLQLNSELPLACKKYKMSDQPE